MVTPTETGVPGLSILSVVGVPGTVDFCRKSVVGVPGFCMVNMVGVVGVRTPDDEDLAASEVLTVSVAGFILVKL